MVCGIDDFCIKKSVLTLHHRGGCWQQEYVSDKGFFEKETLHLIPHEHASARCWLIKLRIVNGSVDED